MIKTRHPYSRVATGSKTSLRQFINLPLLSIGLANNDHAIKLRAFIDTGSQWCLFDKGYAKLLGLKSYKSKTVVPVIGIGGQHIQNFAYFHDLTLVIFKDRKNANFKNAIKINTQIGFLEKSIMLGGILGVYGFLDHFKFTANIPHAYFEIECLF